MIERMPAVLTSDEGGSGPRRFLAAHGFRFAVPALLLAASAACAAQQGHADPMYSTECEAAQAALEHTIQQAAEGNAAAKKDLGDARRQVLDTCLGPQTGHMERSGAPATPMAVPSPFTAPTGPTPPTAMPSTVSPPPPPLTQRATVITTCDPGGCWDSDGHRLNYMGPVLIGPQGVCALQPGATQCPR